MSDEMNATPATESAPVETSAPVAVAPSSIVDMLSDDSLKSEASLSSFKDVNGLAKSYVNLQKMMGSSLRVPSEDASEEARAEFYNKITSVKGVVKLPDPNKPEEVNAFYKALGRPESPDQYDIKIPDVVPQEAIDMDRINNFRSKAFELGLNSQQVQKLMEMEMVREGTMLQADQQQRMANQETLKKMWGASMPERLEAADRMFRMYGQKFPEAAKSLMATAKDEPLIYQMLAELGQIHQERGHLQGETKINFGLTPLEARDKISEIRANRRHAVNDAQHPNHKAAVEELRNLYQVAYPEEDNRN